MRAVCFHFAPTRTVSPAIAALGCADYQPFPSTLFFRGSTWGTGAANVSSSSLWVAWTQEAPRAHLLGPLLSTTATTAPAHTGVTMEALALTAGLTLPAGTLQVGCPRCTAKRTPPRE